jgi:small subunit ribosomal protein S24e
MMEIEITSRRDNGLLGREEIEFVVTHPQESTPERETVRDNIAARVEANTGLVVVDHMDTEYGVTRTEGYAKVYDGVEALRDVENDHILERNDLATGDESDDAGEEEEAQAEA